MTPEDLRATRTRPFDTTVAAASADRTLSSEEEAAPKSLPGPGCIVGMHYRLIKLLGVGNFGKVYEAERIDVPEHRVALKLLPRSFYVGRNLERELVMLAKVGHPHVVQLMDHGVTSDYVWLTMPVYQGETLAERLERGALDAADAHAVFLPIARALEALHHAGLRHQDVKPDNIFLARFAGRLHPILLDLGVAAERDATFVAGTALYAAPEQLHAILGDDSDEPLDESMDVYCFGATLLRSLVGEKRFPGARATTRRDVIQSHQERAEKPLSNDVALEMLGESRDRLQHSLRQWMALDAKARPPMNEVAEELDVLLDPERERDRQAEAAHAAERRSLRRARAAVLVGLLVTVALAGFALWKRETLRLASELEEARAQGAESFDKLDTCVAANAITRRAEQACVGNLTREKADHERTLGTLAKQGEGFGDLVEQVRDLRTKLNHERKTHEDALSEEQESRRIERERLVSEQRRLETERNQALAELKQREQELDSLRQERDTYLADVPNQTAPASSPTSGGSQPVPGQVPTGISGTGPTPPEHRPADDDVYGPTPQPPVAPTPTQLLADQPAPALESSGRDAQKTAETPPTSP